MKVHEDREREEKTLMQNVRMIKVPGPLASPSTRDATEFLLGPYMLQTVVEQG